MKQILKCFMFFIIINILSGCSFKGLSEMMLEKENQDLPSSIGTISSNFSSKNSLEYPNTAPYR